MANAPSHAPGAELMVEFDRAGDNLLVYVAGEIDLATVDQITRPIMDRTDRALDTVWLDLAGVSFCGSVGLAAFVALHQHLERLGGRLVLYKPALMIVRSLQITGLDQLLHIHTGSSHTAPSSLADL